MLHWMYLLVSALPQQCRSRERRKTNILNEVESLKVPHFCLLPSFYLINGYFINVYFGMPFSPLGWSSDQVL